MESMIACSSIVGGSKSVDNESSVAYSYQKSESSSILGSSSDQHIQRRKSPWKDNMNLGSNHRDRRDYVRGPRFHYHSPCFNPMLTHRPPFYGPHMTRPYDFPMMMHYPDLAMMGSLPLYYYNRAMAFRPPPPPIESKIVIQINYYFSKRNLVKDMYLRSKMDEEGWVHISVIASFPKVRELTKSIPLILRSLTSSYDMSAVEVQGDKIRKRYNWKGWVPPPHLLASSSS